MFEYILIVIGAAAVYYLFKPTKKIETTQDLLDYENISPEGIIELPDNKYRLVIEVEPINMNLRSSEEQGMIWTNFKNMVDSLTLPTTFLIQARYLNLRDYLDYLRKSIQHHNEKIKNLAEKHIHYLEKKTEGKQIRDRRYYIILKINAASTGIEGGIKIDNPIYNSLATALKKAPKIKSEELIKIAHSDLMDAASLIMGSLENIEIRTTVLNKKGVIEFLYQTFNRDLAPFATLEEVDSQGMFSLFATSETPENILYEIQQK